MQIWQYWSTINIQLCVSNLIIILTGKPMISKLHFLYSSVAFALDNSFVQMSSFTTSIRISFRKLFSLCPLPFHLFISAIIIESDSFVVILISVWWMIFFVWHCSYQTSYSWISEIHINLSKRLVIFRGRESVLSSDLIGLLFSYFFKTNVRIKFI